MWKLHVYFIIIIIVRGEFLSLLFSFSDFLFGSTVILFYISFWVVPVFSGNVSRALLSFLSLSWAFSTSGFFYAGASETQRWSLTKVLITKIKDTRE